MSRSSAPCRSFFAISSLALDVKGRFRIDALTLVVKGRANLWVRLNCDGRNSAGRHGLIPSANLATLVFGERMTAYLEEMPQGGITSHLAATLRPGFGFSRVSGRLKPVLGKGSQRYVRRRFFIGGP